MQSSIRAVPYTYGYEGDYQLIKRMILTCNDKILQIDRSIEFLIIIYHKNCRDSVILSCLGYQSAHRTFYGKMIVYYDAVCGHPASDFFIVKSIDHFYIMTYIVIQKFDQKSMLFFVKNAAGYRIIHLSLYGKELRQPS